ncbi:MAG: acetyl-CoA carboxylase biotin carboxyl carrier protein [Clostridiales bacterium]|jgi:acetyl-CoA carboxylase biotin carboxyl carrier protein|nr:acetyl-CoA carboxylase biotin carboxyl carrier protein [Clostridiales bacterium]
MNIEEVGALIKMMNESDLKSLEVTEGNLSVRLVRDGGGGFYQAQAQAPAERAAESSSVPLPVINPLYLPAEGAGQAAEPAESGNVIKSPMVGVFYRAAAPDAPPYVQTGQSVAVGDVLCVIEAMKLMNEITAETSGQIAEILVKDGDVVEYGQPLFRLA